MSPVSIILVLLSAFTHAGWNLLSKSENPSMGSFLVGNTAGVLVLLPLLAIWISKLQFISSTVWILLLCTGFFEAVYYSALAQAYQKGDMSLVYPTARSLPIIIVTFALLVMGRGQELSSVYYCGCFLIILGLLMQPLTKINKENIKKIFDVSLLFAVLAAVGTAAYSIIDEKALLLLKETALTVIEAPLIYVILEGLFTSLWLAIFLCFNYQAKARLTDMLKEPKKKAVIMGLGIYITYGLVLVAMMFAKNVGYIVAFRQLSIPIGTFFACLFLKERVYPLKIVGTFLTVTGLILVGAV